MNEPTTYPRVTPGDIEKAINSALVIQYYVFPGTTVTACCVELINGFCVIGTSAAVSPANFDRSIGEKVALDKVRDKLWELLGFKLKEEIHNGE